VSDDARALSGECRKRSVLRNHEDALESVFSPYSPSGDVLSPLDLYLLEQ